MPPKAVNLTAKSGNDLFSKLPPELIEKILDYLDYEEDRLHLMMASPYVRSFFFKPEKWSRIYEVYGRSSLGQALKKVTVSDHFHLTTGDTFKRAAEDLIRAAIHSLRVSTYSFNEAGHIFVAIVPNIRLAEAFCQYVIKQKETRKLTWLNVHRSGGYVSAATRTELRNVSQKKNAVVIITHRSEGFMPKPNKAIMIDPPSSTCVLDILSYGPSEMSIYWPIQENRSAGYQDVRACLRRYNRAKCPDPLWFRQYPELFFRSEGEVSHLSFEQITLWSQVLNIVRSEDRQSSQSRRCSSCIIIISNS